MDAKSSKLPQFNFGMKCVTSIQETELGFRIHDFSEFMEGPTSSFKSPKRHGKILGRLDHVHTRFDKTILLITTDFPSTINSTNMDDVSKEGVEYLEILTYLDDIQKLDSYYDFAVVSTARAIKAYSLISRVQFTIARFPNPLKLTGNDYDYFKPQFAINHDGYSQGTKEVFMALNTSDVAGAVDVIKLKRELDPEETRRYNKAGLRKIFVAEMMKRQCRIDPIGKPLRCIAISYNGNMVATTDYEGIYINVYKTNQSIADPLVTFYRGYYASHITSLSFSKGDDGYIAVTTFEKTSVHIFKIPEIRSSQWNLSLFGSYPRAELIVELDPEFVTTRKEAHLFKNHSGGWLLLVLAAKDLMAYEILWHKNTSKKIEQTRLKKIL